MGDVGTRRLGVGVQREVLRSDGGSKRGWHWRGWGDTRRGGAPEEARPRRRREPKGGEAPSFSHRGSRERPPVLLGLWLVPGTGVGGSEGRIRDTIHFGSEVTSASPL